MTRRIVCAVRTRTSLDQSAARRGRASRPPRPRPASPARCPSRAAGGRARAASSRRRRNNGREASGSSANGRHRHQPAARRRVARDEGADLRSGATPAFDASPERFTSSSAGTREPSRGRVRTRRAVHELADLVRRPCALFDCRCADEVPAERVAVDRVLALQVLGAVLADDLDARPRRGPPSPRAATYFVAATTVTPGPAAARIARRPRADRVGVHASSSRGARASSVSRVVQRRDRRRPRRAARAATRAELGPSANPIASRSSPSTARSAIRCGLRRARARRVALEPRDGLVLVRRNVLRAQVGVLWASRSNASSSPCSARKRRGRRASSTGPSSGKACAGHDATDVLRARGRDSAAARATRRRSGRRDGGVVALRSRRPAACRDRGAARRAAPRGGRRRPRPSARRRRCARRAGAAAAAVPSS